MARVYEPTDEDLAKWREWVESRPPVVRKVAEKLFPWELYRLKTTGQRVTVAAISEDGAVRVDVTGQFNLVSFERTVFGIDPDDLEPCELPAPDEIVGAVIKNPEDRVH